jgi:hypothetical protein
VANDGNSESADPALAPMLSPEDTLTPLPGDNDHKPFDYNPLEDQITRKPALSDSAVHAVDTGSASPDDMVVSHRFGMPAAFVSAPYVWPQLTEGIAVREQHLQLRSLTRAEDGHSANEQRTYLALWNSGNPVLGQPFRRNTIGHAGLAKMLKVDKRQTKRWIPALIEKLTIEIEVESSYATKTTYRVFDRDEIHARRVGAGYTSFIKNRGGVELLKAKSSDKHTLSPGGTQDRSRGDREPLQPGDNETIRTLSPGDTLSPPTGDIVSPGGGDTVSLLYKEIDSKSTFKEDSSSELRTITAHLHTIGINADDDFARQLLRRSRAVCEDSTIAEILHFTEAKAKYRGIQKSLTGFLLTAVPVCLMGESLRLYRQAELVRAAAERESWIQMRSEAELAVNAPEGREAWEIENAESTLKWLREHQPWVFRGASED